MSMTPDRPSHERKTICLNMIVKNEAHVIRRCLDSLVDLIDHWVIVDTGSTDGTQELIRAHLAGVPGELIERPWLSFAHNRSEAIACARGKADYLLIIDADELLERDPGFVLPPLVDDAYQLVIESGGYSYFKTQLIANHLDWCFKNVVHEYLHCAQAKRESVLPGLRTIRHHDGARSRDPNTYRKDALLIEAALLDHPDDHRYVFYLAQSYRDAQDPELALRHYRRRAALGGWLEEVWYSLCQVAELKHRLGHPWPEVQAAYLDAYAAKPDRAEPLFHLGMHYQRRREFPLARLFLERAAAIPYPVEDRLFVEQDAYRFRIAVELAVACYYVGEHERAIALDNQLLAGGQLPAAMVDQVIENRRFSLDARLPRRAEVAARPRPIKVCVPFHDPGPALDSCVESLFQQQGADFQVVFVDDGSSADYRAKIPTEDARVTLVRHEHRRGWAECLRACASAHCGPDDIVFPLSGRDWLADDDVLATLGSLFQTYDCSVIYAQHRYASGHLGQARPLTSTAALGAATHRVAPLAFRAGLLGSVPGSPDDEDATNRALLHAAGLDSARFTDHVLTVIGQERR
jgi:glycosyltransferase involved in cell wall biosynthesis